MDRAFPFYDSYHVVTFQSAQKPRRAQNAHRAQIARRARNAYPSANRESIAKCTQRTIRMPDLFEQKQNLIFLNILELKSLPVGWAGTVQILFGSSM